MNKTWKRALAIILSALLLFTTLPMALAATVADSGTITGTSVTWSLDSDGIMTIAGTGAMPASTVWTSASAVPWHSHVAAIRIVNINGGVTSIGAYAFSGCTKLISTTIPNTVTKIENNAFDGCIGLTTISVPNTTKEIGAFAFNGCTGLKDISILNTTCVIADAGTTISSSAVIYGYNDSTAQKYAQKYGRTFNSLSGSAPAANETPAPAANVNTLDTLLANLGVYLRPAWEFAKKLFAQFMASLNSQSADNTSTTGSGASTSTTNTANNTTNNNAAVASDSASIIYGIVNSFIAFVTSTINNISNTQSASAATTSTTAATGTNAPASNGTDTAAIGSMLSGAATWFSGLLGGLMSTAANASTSTTASAAK